MAMKTVVLAGVFAAGLAGGATATRLAAQSARDQTCGTGSTAQVRTTLYFGTARPQGFVSELEWQLFLRDEVTSRFPDGLTAWDAYGQWRGTSGVIDHDRAKVLLIVHADTAAARERVQAVIARYRTMFDQQSVLWETARVCAAL
jgi:hypothetical protein